MTSTLKILGRKAVAAQVAATKAQILTKWETRCRERVEAAKVQTRAALRDSLPELLDQLVETLNSENPKAELKENTEVAREHAEDRAGQPEYTLDQVIAEYHILRIVLLEFIDEHGVADIEARRICHEFIDLGISKAAVRYMELAAQRQRFQNAEIQSTRMEAERANMAKSAFLANMSHEIRTPLGAIMGFVDLIRESKIEQDANVATYLAVIDRNSHHLLRIIDDILDLTKVEAGKMAIEIVEFQFVEFIADFASLAGMTAREHAIAFDLSSDGPVPERIMSDPTRIRQILSNIVGNAIKFTERGKVSLNVGYANERVTFRIADTGRGISPEQRADLFQAFSQADSSTTRKFGGTGLGLVLTKKLSQALGGDFVLVESEIGKGSLFSMEFPVKLPKDVKLVPLERAESTATGTVGGSESPNLQTMEILLVEDSPDNQLLIQTMLAKTGAKITLANDGFEGLAKALSGNFGVVLMDIQMPMMDGHQTVARLREKGYAGPVVALTAHAMKEERERAVLSGFSHFLTKPVNRKNLTDLLATIHNPRLRD